MKRYSEKIARYALSGCTLLTALVALCAPRTAYAQPANYASERRQIRACVLVSSATGFNNPTPYVFYALENRNDYRPGGWDFLNPIAPSSVSAQTYQRWKNRVINTDPAFDNSRPQSQLFRIGAPLTKNLGAYWEVNLDTANDITLSNFDVVLLPIQGGRNNGNVAFSASQRELLRHYVDQGGTLWVEPEGANSLNSFVGQFFLPLQPYNLGGGVQQIVKPFHPLVTYPLNVSPTEISNLGRYISAGGQFLADPSGNNVRLNPHVVVPIVQQGDAVTVYAGDLGAGHIVITATGVASDLNGLIVGSGGTNKVANNNDINDGAVSGENFAAIPPTDLKLAFNLCGWAGALPVGAANARRTGATQETIGHGIATKWSTFPRTPTPGNPGSGAIIFNNAAFYIDGANLLRAYDVNPQESLSFDGLSPDDGIQDFILGTPYDEIWNTSLGPKSVHYATPTVVSVLGHDSLIVTGSDGTTSIYDALPAVNGRLSGTASSPLTVGLSSLSNNPTLFGSNANAPYSPFAPQGQSYPLTVPGAVYDDGVLFVPVYQKASNATTGAGWHVAAIDLYASLQGGSVVTAFGSGNIAAATLPSAKVWNQPVEALGDLIGPLSVGYVRDISTGAIDEIVYAAVAGDATGTPPTPPYVQGLWFRTRQEPLAQSADKNGGTYWHPQGERARMPWYLGSGSAGLNLAPVFHITHLDANGNVLDINDIAYSSNNGSGPVINFDNGPNTNPATIKVTNLTLPAPIGNGDTYTLTADYALNWPGDAVGTGVMTDAEMKRLYEQRQYRFHIDPNQTPGQTPIQPLATGGVVIGSDDSAILGSSSGLKDQAMVTGVTLPDRIYSVTEQFAGNANNQGRPRATSTAVNWMFSPMHGGNFDGNAIRARLINSDTFRVVPRPPNPPNPDAIQSGQAVQGTTGAPKQNSGQPASGVQMIGTPVVSNGVVYVVANAHFNGAPFTGAPGYYNATVIMALREKIDNTINLETPLTAPTASVTIKQPNFGQSVSGAASYLTLQPVRTDTGLGDFTVDSTTDAQGNNIITALHLLNMQPNGQDCLNVAVPMYLQDGTGQQIPLVNANGYSKLDNLLWWIAIPYSDPANKISPQGNALLLQPDLQYVGGNATSGPAVFGQTLYYNATYAAGAHRYGSIVAVDLKSASDGRIIDADTGVSRVHVLATMTDPFTGGPYDLANTGITTPVINPPAAAVNTVVDGVGAGLAALDNQVTLIADSNRLIEVDAFSNAVWTLNSTISSSVVGGPLSSGNGGVASQSVPLSRPTTARHTETNVYAVADTENNRIIQVDRGGQVITEIHGLNNGMNFLQPGEPLTLNHPADVQIYVDQQPNGTISIANRNTNVTYSYTGPYYAIHYVVADTGNNRALEIVSVYNTGNNSPVTMTGSDGSSALMLQQVIFSTRSLAEQNASYRYRTIQEFREPVTGNTYMIAAVDNVQQPTTVVSGNVTGGAGPTAEAPGGSLTVIRRYNNTDGNVAYVFNNIAIPDATLANVVRRQPINGPTFFREFDYVNPNAATTAIPRFLMCDSGGCYLLSLRHVDGKTLNLNSTDYNELVVEWMLTDTDYYYLTGRHLRATSIQRLTQAEIYTDANGNKAFAPHYLITNNYTGRDNIEQVFGSAANPLANVAAGDIHGEVFEIRSRDYYDDPNGNVAIDQNNGGVYDGYHYLGFTAASPYQLYVTAQSNGYNLLYPNLPSLTGNATGSSIVRMVPAETIQYSVVNNQSVKTPIKRSIGDPGNATTSNLLQQPLFSERPF